MRQFSVDQLKLPVVAVVLNLNQDHKTPLVSFCDPELSKTKKSSKPTGFEDFIVYPRHIIVRMMSLFYRMCDLVSMVQMSKFQMSKCPNGRRNCATQSAHEP